jgi:hypothetical protein
MEVQTQQYGVIPAVSRALQDQAFLDGAAMMANAGGLFSARAERHPTDLPGEMLTLYLICEWRDRTDAKSQPEPEGELMPALGEQEAPRLTAEEWAAAQDIQDAANPEAEALARIATAPEVHQVEVPDSPDGLDYTQLEDEDLAEVPEGAR